MSAMFSPSVSRPFTCTERTTPKIPQVHQPKQLRRQRRTPTRFVSGHPPRGCKQWSCRTAWRCTRPSPGTSCRSPQSTTAWRCRGGRTGLLRTPTQNHHRHSDETSERGGDVRSRPAHHLLHFSAAQLNPEPTLAAVAARRAKRAAPPANRICRIKATAGYLPKKLGGAQTPNSHTQNDYSVGRLVGRCFTPS